MSQDWKSLYRKKEEREAETYTEAAMDHFVNPRHLGHVDQPHGLGRVGDPDCGDYLELSLRLDDRQNVADIGFMVQGCAGAISTSSMVTERSLIPKVGGTKVPWLRARNTAPARM